MALNFSFGCCPDGITTAIGKDFEGCEVAEECEESGSGSCMGCEETMFGCCPDGVTSAKGESLEGCPEEASGSGEGSGKHFLCIIGIPMHVERLIFKIISILRICTQNFAIGLLKTC